uniref:Uncharacterized protein n=1 Tax=Anopheles christyi TaxID=43041 RepID=A0A182KII5_9DIPT
MTYAIDEGFVCACLSCRPVAVPSMISVRRTLMSLLLTLPAGTITLDYGESACHTTSPAYSRRNLYRCRHGSGLLFLFPKDWFCTQNGIGCLCTGRASFFRCHGRRRPSRLYIVMVRCGSIRKRRNDRYRYRVGRYKFRR